MRCFLALCPDADGAERLEILTRPLRQWDLPARWQHHQDYHLTLCFLGHLDHQEAFAVRYSVDELAGSLVRPALALSGLGAFGGKTYPKVLYCGITDAEQRCIDYHHNLCDALSIRPNRDFHPHITLCRPQGPGERLGRGWAEMIGAFGGAEWGPITMSHLVLYESRGGPGQRYHPLHAWPLIPHADEGRARSAS
ncbi:MAG: RNA 2',3'-cyclic phosphodiesterase [Planctomycetota bacterium]|nr:MAG: RNA 2',3'-cyclic phosphodiesterase [Planctomycetota bacterium]